MCTQVVLFPGGQRVSGWGSLLTSSVSCAGSGGQLALTPSTTRREGPPSEWSLGHHPREVRGGPHISCAAPSVGS